MESAKSSVTMKNVFLGAWQNVLLFFFFLEKELKDKVVFEEHELVLAF